MPRLDTLVMLVFLTISLLFHFWFCLVPSLRYFRARRGAYLLGVAAYVLIGLPPLIDTFVVLLTEVAFRVYFVIAALLFSVVAWRPYAFVHASGGPCTRRMSTN